MAQESISASFNWDWILIKTNISVKHLLRLHFFSTAVFKRFANKPDLRTSQQSRAAFKPRPILSPRAHRNTEPFPQQAAASSLRLSKFGVLRRGTPALPRRKTHKHTSPTPKPSAAQRLTLHRSWLAPGAQTLPVRVVVSAECVGGGVWVCWGMGGGGPHSSSLCHHTARAEATQKHYTTGHVLVLTTSAACEQPSATFL